MDKKTLSILVLLGNILPVAPGIGTILYSLLVEGLPEEEKRNTLTRGIIQIALWFGGAMVGFLLSFVFGALTLLIGGIGSVCGLGIGAALPLGGWIWAIVDGINLYGELSRG